MEPFLILGALGLALAAMAKKKPAASVPASTSKPKPQVVIEEGTRDLGAPPPSQTAVMTDEQMLRDFADSLGKALGLDAQSGQSQQQIAARTLRAYILKTGDFGTVKPSAKIRTLQKGMGGGLKPDGIVGPLTRSRSLVLGVELPGAQPRKTATKPQTAAAAQSRPEPHWLPEPPASRPAPAAAPRPAASAAPAAQPAASEPPAKQPIPSKAAEAARSLRTYLEGGGYMGSKKKPDATVKGFQKVMGGLTPDGIYGPKTQARARALGTTLKTREAYLPKITIGPAVIEKEGPMLAPKAATDPKKQAALALAVHLEAHGAPGTKAKPDSTVKALQKRMGSVTADGIYGPKTEARARALGAIIRPRAAYAE